MTLLFATLNKQPKSMEDASVCVMFYGYGIIPTHLIELRVMVILFEIETKT